jgi:hypothetical protein
MVAVCRPEATFPLLSVTKIYEAQPNSRNEATAPGSSRPLDPQPGLPPGKRANGANGT